MTLNEKLMYLRVWGDFACFTNPLLKVERVSYPVPTPSACRGILESLMYKKEFRYEVNSVAVRKPIRFQSIRRNELKSIVKRNKTPIIIEKDRTQRNTLALRKVEYVICFRIIFDGPPERTDGNTTINTTEKYHNCFVKYVERGHIRRTPCLGCKEFVCGYELATEQDMVVQPIINPDNDFGMMLYDCYDLDKHDSERIKRTVFDSKLRNGIVQYPPWNVIKSKYLEYINQ